MTAKVIGSGQWDTNDRGILMTTVFQTSTLSPAPQQHQNMWSIGQIVDVRPRTWAGYVGALLDHRLHLNKVDSPP